MRSSPAASGRSSTRAPRRRRAASSPGNDVAPAPALALRFCFALAILAVGYDLLWSALRASGLIGSDLTKAGYYEASMLVFAVPCAAVGLFAIWQPPGCPWRPVRAARVLAVYLPFAIVWVALLIGY